ncbi:IS3 family transposase, partial [Paenibacillus macquariensis]|uniref:IS3 family transposase n=1 Tax=Paenibacillus macquariensis TaxID=948756 RepID=UPI000A9FD4BD
PSSSRQGTCFDNASLETFFSHMTDDLEYRSCMTLTELRAQVDDYITYYNSERYQWALKKMTPDEFRSHLLTA